MVTAGQQPSDEAMRLARRRMITILAIVLTLAIPAGLFGALYLGPRFIDHSHHNHHSVAGIVSSAAGFIVGLVVLWFVVRRNRGSWTENLTSIARIRSLPRDDRKEVQAALRRGRPSKRDDLAEIERGIAERMQTRWTRMRLAFVFGFVGLIILALLPRLTEAGRMFIGAMALLYLLSFALMNFLMHRAGRLLTR